jgi:hypothetical protein
MQKDIVLAEATRLKEKDKTRTQLNYLCRQIKNYIYDNPRGVKRMAVTQAVPKRSLATQTPRYEGSEELDVNNIIGHIINSSIELPELNFYSEE